MRRSWVTGVAVVAVLVGVVALAVVRGRPQPGEPEPQTPATAVVDSVLPASLRASLERGGPIDAVLTVPSTVPDRGMNPQIPIGDGGVGITFRSPFVPLTELHERQLRESLLRVRRPELRPDCTFQPDIAFRFGASPDSLRVVVCHGCGEAMVLSTGPGWMCMLGFESDTLLALTAELFPGDDRIADYRSQRAGR